MAEKSTAASIGSAEQGGGEPATIPPAVAALLGKFVCVTLSDDRVVTGTFACTDRDANLILKNGGEYIKEEGTAELKFRRNLPYTMVPGEHIQKLEVEQTSAVA